MSTRRGTDLFVHVILDFLVQFVGRFLVVADVRRGTCGYARRPCVLRQHLNNKRTADYSHTESVLQFPIKLWNPPPFPKKKPHTRRQQFLPYPWLSTERLKGREKLKIQHVCETESDKLVRWKCHTLKKMTAIFCTVDGILHFIYHIS